MNSFKLAIIRPVDNLNLDELSTDEQWDVISSFIEFVDTTPEDMMSVVVETIDMSPELMGDTYTCSETTDAVYQFCFLSKTDNNLSEDRPLNRIATWIYDDPSKEIHGSIVLMKSVISSDHICTHGSLEMEEIRDIIDEVRNHTGVLVKTDGSLSPFRFTSDPVRSVTNPNNYSFTDLEIFGFSLLLFIQLIPDDQTTNHHISTLLGTKRVEGDVIVTSIIDQKKYGKLTPETLLRILNLSVSSLDDRTLTPEESQRGQKTDSGLLKVINGYHILNMREAMEIKPRSSLYPEQHKSLNQQVVDSMK